ncbi:acyl-CoA thioesterase [Geodermatophilus normandii]|uniref:Acyl-CoA thioesterase n=1 Tax=Geodermatophilus normandii TaxID=1137989 RepID=A0A6P0GN95_9ACTN|nr:thioesterase family protein [Geodermatophilus normandii]NEM06677.1 acyl-CoA thioesterase [Geodermatophilus normandii]NEM08401.1 acyl-CoA thioesterase [Geodermatophilus normandii]
MSERHEHPVQLRWSDTDVFGHVNHARVLGLLEDARLSMVDSTPGAGIILARLEIDYLRQVHYRVGEHLRVTTSITRLGRSSIGMRQELTQDGEVALRADMVLVAFDYAADASVPLTDDQRAHWSRWLTDRPGDGEVAGSVADGAAG